MVQLLSLTNLIYQYGRLCDKVIFILTEKRSLELKTSTLNERAESSVSDIEKLQGKVSSKEEELKATRG